MDVKSQTISNIDYTVKGKNIEITYDLLGAIGLLNIEVYYSIDQGKTYIGPLHHLSGDVGFFYSSIKGRKKVFWYVLKEVESVDTPKIRTVKLIH